MTQSQLAARRKGGLSRSQKYSSEQLRQWASRGGRPRNLTLEELRATEALEK